MRYWNLWLVGRLVNLIITQYFKAFELSYPHARRGYHVYGGYCRIVPYWDNPAVSIIATA